MNVRAVEVFCGFNTTIRYSPGSNVGQFIITPHWEHMLITSINDIGKLDDNFEHPENDERDHFNHNTETNDVEDIKIECHELLD
jgi:hypothetical protein